MAKEIDRRLGLQASGAMLPFTVFDADGEIAGMTTYMNVDAANRRVEIGSTWYARRVQRSAVNTQCKLLLLAHAFETLDCIAVEFRTHFFNHQSRRGIERLGAKQDGILRNHQIAPNGTLRDTVVYSIIAGGMADGEGASDLSIATRRRGSLPPGSYDGHVRLCDRGGGLGRLRYWPTGSARTPARASACSKPARATGTPTSICRPVSSRPFT